MASESKENGKSRGLNSDKSVGRSCSSDSSSFLSNASTSGVGGPADDCESGDPGVSMIISTESAGDGVGDEGGVSIVRVLSISAGEISCRSMGDDGSSLVVEEAVEPEGDGERFDELERFRWLYLK